ncbi:primase C-terminal domain-containing protein (plasmid) [Klebsiella pneumoniae]|nr:primase C-terminal domain-containing protein [Klebsiella pneumoniae]
MQAWEPRLYDLAWLSDYLDLSSYNGRKSLPEYGLGRNRTCSRKRARAYKAIRQGWPDYPEWLAACVDRASGYNAQFEQPLPANEVRHTAKSIAKWTHQHQAPQGSERSRPGEVRRAARYPREGRPSIARTSPIYCRRFCGLRLRGTPTAI